MLKRVGAITVAITALSLALWNGPTANTRWGSLPAAAATQAPSITINTTVVGNCTSITPNSPSLTIGTTYDPFTYPAGTPLKNTTPLVLSTNCTNGDAISWTVGIGSNCNKGSGAAGDRAMTDGSSHYLSYELFTSSSFTTQYGTNSCGTPTSTPQTGNGSSTANTLSIYGAVPGGQNVAVSSYSDTVTVTLSY